MLLSTFCLVLVVFQTFQRGMSMECYVCVNQEDNHQKCLNTIKTCEQGEDTCLTEVRWGTPPYWQQGGEKQYYVSKRCTTRQICDRNRTRFMNQCTYVWYEDWRCVQCCYGDRCNYHVILGASTSQVNVLLLLLAGFCAIFITQR